MIKLNAFAVSGLLITITYLPLFALILKTGKNKLSRIFSLYLLSILLWGIGSFIAATNKNPELALLSWNIAYSPVPFIPTLCYHSVLLFFEKRNKNFLLFSYIQAFLFFILSLSGFLFKEPRLLFNQYYSPIGTSLYEISFFLWCGIITIAHFHFFLLYKNSYPNQKKQLFGLMIATTIGFIGGISNFLPQFNILVYPYGNFLIPIHSFAVIYAILRHQIFNIHIIIRKTFIYSFLIAIITLFYLGIVLLSEKFLQEQVGYKSILVSLVTAFGLGLFFIPIRNRIQIFVDKIFFKNTREEIARENELLRQEITQTEKLKSIATLASGMAHEIKNPLTAIKTFCEYLPQKLENKEFLEKFSRIVKNEVDRIDNIVHQLLEFAKPSPLALKNINIYDLINSILEFLNNNFIKHKIKISKDFDKDNPKVLIKVDSNQLRQAFLNIFLNAIDAMKTGGNLLIRTKISSNILHITIQDTGPGISKRNLKYIFDPFYTKKDEGTGLGLSITQRIIIEHKGVISAESQDGVGTKFIIQLPIESAD
ncbi:MAG: ATP-binding protein [Candidatus Aceula lacicola]|nr:ATP-binding protein [Candidatus Aceula lacicola]